MSITYACSSLRAVLLSIYSSMHNVEPNLEKFHGTPYTVHRMVILLPNKTAIMLIQLLATAYSQWLSVGEVV